APVAAPVRTGAAPRPAGIAGGEALRPRPRARPAEGPDGRRCSPDGRVCVARATYAADICRAIEGAAAQAGLPPAFLARLLWQESLFEAGAVSPKGAQGIAQFMPGTARERGLIDPFNPAEAIGASALLLRDLRARFGNLGLAAAAYNAGAERVERFLAGAAGLPAETRSYVLAITGHVAEAWRGPRGGGGAVPAVRWTLEEGRPFAEACRARAEGRGMGPPPQPALAPWAVILSAQADRAAAERAGARAVAAHPGLLGGERVALAPMRVAGRERHVAQVGRQSRAEAEALCARLRAAGGACTVLRN
ncbi:lytic transglycosylase domain-containing protein, partial [Rubellimicrobium sp. CFH 75288]|uniref:lytic transglycosylase domain-containing protein n=1 Tax=Rubellimicrobium sp. CFH 75288 TaxID=2697034 RepID=UPI00141245A8